MPGDDVNPENHAGGGTSRARSGPRHAAPRRSVLRRVQLPAGKAIALAAMPTAVLMGMGLTPRLAQADELPKNPFSGDHCVSQSDSPSPDTSPSDSPSTKPSPSASGSSDAGKNGSGTKAKSQPTASATPDATKSGTTTSGTAKPDTAKADTAKTTPSPSASTSSKASGSSEDPLGLGSILGGLLGGLTGSHGSGSGSTPTPTASPTPSATPSTSPSTKAGSGGGSGSGGSGAAGTVTKTVQGAAKSVTDAAKGATQDVKKSADAATSPKPDPSGSVTPGMAYPCPTYNPKALADAKPADTGELLADQPWTLKSDMLTLTGLAYDGIVTVRTESGATKDVLKFTATGVDIKNLHQLQVGPDGTTINVGSAPGSTSTIKNGTVTMYTQELKGNLLGLIPVDFTPKSPPPLTIPIIFFTDVTVVQAGQFGGDLTVPGMHVYKS
ncbi:hypothetical protein K7472_28215 [Streptomyces sp. PTM05]|uniref:Uncharacterized protein n=1 Tax=Streptantibioticus parmotrematis TaxID=2873249 RepID=A0ABS7QZS1_9ACTN|nr:hypothetical protein [Streptantibioticus parmotrematis]MBY8888700.1 hypothetical protein [Streptantibioticus parmotrematis]